MVTIRKRWPRPGTTEIVDQSEDIGPGGASMGRVSNGGANMVGNMVAPSKEYLAGLSNWKGRRDGLPSALTVVRGPKEGR